MWVKTALLRARNVSQADLETVPRIAYGKAKVSGVVAAKTSG